MTGLPTRVVTGRCGAAQGPRMTGSPGRRLLLVVWLSGLIVGIWLFHASGNGPLAAPPLDPAAWSDWLAQRDALIASIAVLRLVVLVLSWYLVGATTIGTLLRVTRAARLVRIADILTVPFVRRLLQATLGASLATAMVVSATPAVQALDDVGPTIPSVRSLDDAGLGADPRIGSATAPDVRSPAVSVDHPGEMALERTAPRRPLKLESLDRGRNLDRAGIDGVVVEEFAGEVIGGHADEHVVAAGDSLWSIAAAALVDVDGQRPDDHAVAAYWLAVVDANRDGLSDPGNPDLIFPGQVVHLPTAST